MEAAVITVPGGRQLVVLVCTFQEQGGITIIFFFTQGDGIIPTLWPYEYEGAFDKGVGRDFDPVLFYFGVKNGKGGVATDEG